MNPNYGRKLNPPESLPAAEVASDGTGTRNRARSGSGRLSSEHRKTSNPLSDPHSRLQPLALIPSASISTRHEIETSPTTGTV